MAAANSAGERRVARTGRRAAEKKKIGLRATGWQRQAPKPGWGKGNSTQLLSRARCSGNKAPAPCGRWPWPGEGCFRISDRGRRVGVRLADCVSARQGHGPGHGCTVQCLTSFSWNEVGSKYTFEKPLYRTKSNPITEESTIGGRSLRNTF